MSSNNFIALKSWYDANPEEIAFFMKVWGRAMDEFEAMLRSRVEEPGAMEALGHLELDRRRAGAAAQWFDRALRLDPERLALLVSAGRRITGRGMPPRPATDSGVRLNCIQKAEWLGRTG